jgi:hypothetical protein
MPAFEEGKTTAGAKDWYEKLAQKVIDHGHAGNASVLEDMKADGMKPNAKGKVSNTWAGKTANSKKLLALHDQAMAHAKGEGSGYAAPAAAADPLSVHDTPASKVLHVIPSSDAKAGYEVHVATPKSAPGSKFSVAVKDVDSGEFLPSVKMFPKESDALEHAHALADGKKPGAAGPKEGDTKPGADGSTLVLKDGHWVKQGGDAPAPAAQAADTGNLSAQQIQNLQSIPWFKLKLPAENTNAKSHNAALAKIESMAFAGHVAGLKAFADGKAGAKQTYAKKQYLLAVTAIAALQGGWAAPALAGGHAVVSVSESDPAVIAAANDLNAIASPSPAQTHIFKAITSGEYPAHVIKNSAGKIVAAASFGVDKDGHIELDQLGSTVPGGGSALVAAAKDLAKQKGVPLMVTAVGDSTGFYKKQGFTDAQGGSGRMVFGAAAPAPAAATVEPGPQEGDTKQGADGMLVLKNGHWVKAGEDMGGWDHSASNPGLDGNPSLELSKDGKDYYLAGDSDNGFEFGVIDESSPEPSHVQGVTLAELVGQMKAMGYPIPPVAALQKLDPSYKPAPAKIKKATLIDISTAIQTITPGQTKFSTNAAGKLATAAAKKGDGPGMAAAYTKAIAISFPKTASHIKAVAEAMGVDTSEWNGGATPAAAPPVTTVSSDGTLSMDGWAQTGGQGGSNPGGKFKDPTGQEWYCKFPKDADTAKSEILAAKLYALAGLSSQDAVLVTKDGKVGIASKWVDIKKAASPGALAKVDGAQAGFAVDAWLGNWDVVGLEYDNLQVGPDGKAHRVDAGGSLEYRAQGEKKAFGSKVEELDTLLDAGKNAQTASVFKGMTKADLTASAAKVLAISDVAIRAMVNQYGPGDAAAKTKLAETLIARKKDIAAKFPAAAKKKKAPAFKPEEISAPPSFLNWGGGGKSGPSSKEFLNKANEDAVQAIFAAAKTGDADAVKKLTAPVFDKDTGAVTGHKPVLEHPSQHVKGYAQQAINEITYQLNPPKQFRFDGGHPLHSLNAAYPAHKGSPSSAVAQKLGKFIVLGTPGVVSLADVGLPEKIVHSEGGGSLSAHTYAKQAQAAIAKMPATQKQAVKSYTGSSYHSMNGSLWDGNPSGAAKAAGEALKTLGHDIAPGTVLSRKISLHGADLQQLLGASGKILQEPAIMSTSIRPSSWSGNVHLKLHVGPGVKGLWVGHHSIAGGGALSSNSGEDEMILPPGTRLMIMGVKTGADKDGFGKSSGHVIEAIILPTE